MEDFFLMYGFYPWGRTAFRHVTALDKGTIVEWRDGTTRRHPIRFGNPWPGRFEQQIAPGAPERDVIEALYDGFMLALREQVTSDERVGVLLGGFDSALVAAAWFGAMIYSLAVLQPRAARFFASDREFEDFIATISDGARWKVLTACLLLAATGIGLTIVLWRGAASPVWLALVTLKGALLLVALALFAYVSWWLWPARILAAPDEIPVFQRRFRLVGWSLIGLVGLGIALGLAARLV